MDKNRDRNNSRDHQPKRFDSTDSNQQNSSMYSGEKRSNSQDRNSRSVRFKLRSRNENGGRNNYSLYGSRDQVPDNLRQSSSYTNTRNQPTSSHRNDIFQNAQRNSSKSHSNLVVIVYAQIIFQTNAKHTSIANASDIYAVVARRPEPIR